MSRLWRQLAVGLAGLVVSGLFIFLGLWQMEVFRSQGDNSVAAVAAKPVVPLEENLTDGRTGAMFGRTVTITGRYLDEPPVLVGEEYPARLVQAFRTENDRTVAVVRGTVVAGQSAPAVPTDAVTLTGVVLPTQGHGPVSDALPAGSMGSVRLEVLAQEWPSPMLDGYLTLRGADSAALGLGEAPLIVPDQRGNVRNEGYALQWWAFAAFGLVMTWIGVKRVGASDEAASEPAELGK